MQKFSVSLKRNMILLLEIEIIVLFIYTYVIIPVCELILKRVMRAQNYGYFFDKNILSVVKNIWILLTLLGIVLFIGLCFYLEIMLLINVIIYSDNKILNVLKKSLFSIKKLFSPFGLVLLLISFFASMLMHFNFLTRIIQTLKINQYFRYYYSYNPKATAAVSVTLLFIIYLVIRFLFVYPILSYEDVSIKESFNLSARLMKKYLITTSIKVLFVNILALLFFAIFYLLIIFITIMVIKSNVIVRLQYAISMTVIDSVNRMLIFFYSLAMIIINLEASVFLCKKLSTKKPRIYSEIPIILKEDQNRKKRGRIWSLIVIIALIIFVFTNDDFLFSFRLRTGYNPEGKKPNIIAHRGNSNAAPENTLSALSSAIDVKADGAEIDVRMTKDGEIVLMHDSKLLRTAGVNSHVNQLNYSELSDIDVGSWFSPEFKGERIPTLMEALDLCKDKLNLMIEVKSDKNKEHEIAKKVLENVEAMGMEDDVIIASFNPKVLDEVKKYNKKIPTCLILRFAYGNIEEMEYVDIFSIESRFMQIKLLQSIQNKGKSLIVWNVSESNQIVSLNHLDIDAIIIGDPIRAREIIYEDAAPGFMNKILRQFLMNNGIYH